MSRYLKLIFLGIIFILFPLIIQATVINFNVDPAYDFLGRSNTTAFLQQIGEKAYFYVEDGYYQSLDDEGKREFSATVKNLSQEFDDVIYLQLTGLYGSEWRSGIDGDNRVTILLTRIKEENGGYFNSGDEYPKAQVALSNEREMIYLNANHLENPLVKSYLAHEFIHLITFNQKDKTYGISEETWLNEARAEYAPTLLGYDEDYENSNLKNRVRTFLQKPTEPLAEWKNLSTDYGALNLFTQYLVDHYGAKILADSLKSNKSGIPSLNEAFKKNRYSEDFSQVFTDWLITVLINNCEAGSAYCYLNPNLKQVKILPQLNYLPLVGESILTVTDYTKDWSGNWIKFIGGQGTLKLEFIGDSNINFEVPYITQDSSGNYSVNFLELDDFQQGTVYVPSFGTNYDSLIMIPFSKNKLSGFNGLEPYHQFIWSASIIDKNSEKEEEKLIGELLAQIALLQQQILQLQTRINAILAERGESIVCSSFENNLYYGMANNNEVRCLQEFLKNQSSGIYPEGLITGNFSFLTQNAVIRFQEKYTANILTPIGLEKGTGFVGAKTRAKINELLAK